jgi:hypothetical protein
MESLKISAYMATPFIAVDDWSPGLDQILIWALLDQHNRLITNPDAVWAAQNQDFIMEHLPLEVGTLCGHWYHKCSAPEYLYQPSGIMETVKMWTQQDQHLDWGGAKRNWNVQGFSTKTWRHKDPLRDTPRIDWYCVGDGDGIQSLLKNVDGLGKRRYGQILQWQVEPWDDWHLSRNGELTKPIPVSAYSGGCDLPVRRWGWRSPARLPENTERCYMPTLAVNTEWLKPPTVDWFEETCKILC